VLTCQITILSQASEFRDYRIKPSERVLYREINQSPLIMYPVKEAVTETRHKIFLMVQMHLGAIQYPTNGDGATLRWQLMMEQKLVIERLSRLVRAVVDCKGHDRDSIGTKTALELARGLAAGSWEGRPTQLTQIPNIGPVGMRKLASRDVRTVLQLADKQCEEIERLMSRQPPFGKQLKAQLDRFPRLKIDATIVGHRVQPTNEEPVSLNIKATLRYLNTGLPIWMNRVPTINFFAETSSGTLVYFWRGTVRKLESPEGVELKFSAGLKHPREHLVCHFTCEEIVGTIVSTTLQHGLPASLFPKRPVRQDVPKPAPVQKRTEQNEEVFGDDDIDDMDMIMAVDQVVARSISTQAQVWSDKADDFPSPDELIEMNNLEEDDGQPFGDDAADRHNDFVSVPDSEPVRLPNGKWKCNHLCSGGVLTRSGKPCSHRCCKEGLDKPRKPRQRQRRQSRDSETGKLDDQSAAAKRQLGGDQPSMPTKRQKVQATLDQVSIKQSAQSTPAVKTANVKGESSSTSLNDLDCIDLSFSDDDDDWFMSLDELIASKQAAKTPGQTSANVRPDRPKSAPTSRPATDRVVEGKEMSKSPLPPTQYQDDDLDDFDISFLDAATASHGEGPKDSNGVVMSKRESEDPISGANTTSLKEVENQPYDSPGTFSSQNLGTDIKREDPETPQGPNPNSLAKTEDSEKIGAADKGIKKEDNEPAWVAEFDQDVIDMFRGYVTFV
jgi:ATP-dependent DNA helicase HFM1/MER3